MSNVTKIATAHNFKRHFEEAIHTLLQNDVLCLLTSDQSKDEAFAAFRGSFMDAMVDYPEIQRATMHVVDRALASAFDNAARQQEEGKIGDDLVRGFWRRNVINIAFEATDVAQSTQKSLQHNKT